MRALVLGASGLLGHRLYEEAKARHETFAAVRNDLASYTELGLFDKRCTIPGVELSEPVSLERAFRVSRPDLVFNAAAVLGQRAGHDGRLPMLLVNAVLPHRLARLCRVAGARLVHMSTDGVFSGSRGRYREDDTPDATDDYGRTKTLGEVQDGQALTVRACVVGREIGSAKSLLEWYLSQDSASSVRGFIGARFTAVTAPVLARILCDLAERADLVGVWHLAGPAASKCEFLTRVRDVFGGGAAVVPDDSVACDRTLDGSHLAERTGLQVPGWEQMLEELYAERGRYDRWRELTREAERSPSDVG